MFYLVLPMPVDTPAQRALDFAVIGASKYKARRGRHTTNLLSLLRSDLKEYGLGTLKTRKRLGELRRLALDKTHWPKAKRD